MKINILIDSNEFWNSLQSDVLGSKDYVFLQTLSFEGDSVGKKVSDLLLSSKGKDRRILIDAYTRYVLSDKFLYAPKNLFNTELRRESSETKRLVTSLPQNGVQVKFANHVGPLLKGLVRRNHKKLVVIDDAVSYIGGINFSEHNFFWHDMMLRIESADIARFLRDDFLSTWDGRNLRASKDFGGIKFYLFDGYSSEEDFAEILEQIRSAKESVVIESPYLTFPFTDVLREVRGRGVPITLIAAERNNRKFMDGYIRCECVRSGFDLWLYTPRMTHLKTMLIDDRLLLVGSCNFEFMSLIQQETLAVIKDSKVIAEFKERVIEEDLRQSTRFDGNVNAISGRLSTLRMHALAKPMEFLGRVW